VVQWMLDDVLGVRDRQLLFERTALEPSPLTALLVIVVAPMLEEIAFRWFPLYMDLSFLFVVGLSGIWALAHGKQSPEILVLVPILLKLALGGFIEVAILVHAVVNCIGYAWQAIQYRGASSLSSDGSGVVANE